MADNPVLPATGVPVEGKDIGGGVIRQFNAIRSADGLAGDLLRGSYTDRSLTITTGGTSQQLMAANTTRTKAVIQNPSSAVGSIFINFGAAAVADSNSIELPPGDRWVESLPASAAAINVIAATTGQKVIAKEM